jgi:Protein of unknown function DUF72
MAWPLLSHGPGSEASARILRQPVRNRGAEWRLLSHAPNPIRRAGAMKPAGTSSSLGKRRSSSPTGNACPRTRSTACNFSMTGCRSLGIKPGLSCFSCRQISRQTRAGSALMTVLPERRRYSFEFRHPSWYAPNILRMLGDRNVALCISDHHDAPAPWERTADFIYLRGRGPSGRYEGRYSRATLAAWRESIRTWQRDLCDVYAYFDNDQKSAAPKDALALLRLLAR